MKRVKFTAIIGMAMMMFAPAISLASSGTQVEVVDEGIRYGESTYPYSGGIVLQSLSKGRRMLGNAV